MLKCVVFKIICKLAHQVMKSSLSTIDIADGSDVETVGEPTITRIASPPDTVTTTLNKNIDTCIKIHNTIEIRNKNIFPLSIV